MNHRKLGILVTELESPTFASCNHDSIVAPLSSRFWLLKGRLFLIIQKCIISNHCSSRVCYEGFSKKELEGYSNVGFMIYMTLRPAGFTT